MTALSFRASHKVNSVSKLLVVGRELTVHGSVCRYDSGHAPGSGGQRSGQAMVVYYVHIQLSQKLLCHCRVQNFRDRLAKSS